MTGAPFTLDTSGAVETGYKPGLPGMHGVTLWRDLDAFTQGYIEALFNTSVGDLTGDEWTAKMDAAKDAGDYDGQPEGLPTDTAFSDLAPETLARIIADCAAFQCGAAFHAWGHFICGRPSSEFARYPNTKAGRDFWNTRNSESTGAGFTGGGWPEPHATALHFATRALFNSVSARLGDDGKVYLS